MSTVSKTKPPRVGGIFSARATVVDSATLHRSLRRIAHEIHEQNGVLHDVILVGIQRGGVPVARLIQDSLKEISGITVPVNELDVTAFRDDVVNVNAPDISDMIASIADKTVILVDDVLYTGRTVRAALNTLFTYGRPLRVQLAVVADRGHREIPIRADYVVKNIPTKHTEHIRVTPESGVELGEIEEAQ